MLRRRGLHRRPRSRRLIALRAFIAIGVLFFLVAQPTGASSSVHLAVGTTTVTSSAPVHFTTTVPPTLPPPTLPPTTLPPAPVATAAPKTTPSRPSTPHYPSSAAPVALTFDDGPNETFTPQVLDILAHYGLHATFFVVGNQVERSPDLTRRIVSEGHALGNHTWDHVDLTTLDEQGFRAQVDRTEDLLTTFTGHRVACARPPFGRINQFARNQLAARGLTMTRWSSDTEDWKEPGTDEIVRRALAGAKPGAVILMHDSGPDMSHTIEALPRIIEGIFSRGLRVAPMCAGAAAPSSVSTTTTSR